MVIISYNHAPEPSSPTVITHETSRRSFPKPPKEHLQLLHGDDIGGLHVVFVLLNLLLQLVRGHFVILDDQVDLQLLDTEANGDELGSTPDQTVLLDGKYVGLELLKVGLVVCSPLVM
jgi:hypothetical protein